MTAKRSKKWHVVGVLVTLLLGGAGAAGAFFVRRLPPRAPTVASLPEPPPVLPPIDGLSTDFPGVLTTPASADLASTIEGRVTSLNVKVGDVVPEGAVLLSLDDRLHKDQLAVAEAGRRAASAEAGKAAVELAQARDRSSRRGSVVKIGDEAIPVVSAEEATDAKFQARAAGAKAASAGAAAGEQAARVRVLKTALDETRLRAPFAGSVAMIYASAGTFLRPGAPALRLIDTRALSVRFAVPEENAKWARPGVLVTVRLDGRAIEAKIDTVAPEVEASSRTVFVEAALAIRDATEIAMLAGRVVRVAKRDADLDRR